MSQRNPIIDVCKGIGILLVIIGHLGTVWGTPIYMFHMSLFFILSGVCLSDKYLDKKVEFAYKRFVSLMLPFIVFKGMAYAAIHFGPWPGAEVFIDKYHLLGTLWFLKCLFIASVLGLAIIWILRRAGCNKSCAPAVAALLLSTVLSITIGDENRAVFVWFTFHFLVGYAIKPYMSTLCNVVMTKGKLLLLGGGNILILLLPSVTPDIIADCTYVTYLPYCVTAFLGSWITLIVSSYLVSRKILVNTLILIGQNTLPIMLFHFMAFMIVDLVIEYGLIEVYSDLFVIIAKFNMGIIVPIIMDIVYVYGKNKLKLIRR